MTGNVVFANRNFMPFFLTGNLPQFGSHNKNYGDWNQDYIIDGQGVYITRNIDYEGTMNLENNIAFI